ncbi:MAG: carbohydrate ABC transporter permease [Candidatus Cloacimonadales bacterium]|jgi:multiple sugar transport system permease protein|nr:carbohydrate ABC transporter permease [Candidatus Cloacimonadales bacterium]
MSIISKVGKKSIKTRTLNSIIHFVLITGALTMIYPFLLMISFSFKSAVDSTNLKLIPAFLYQDEALYKKYMESRYNEESSRLMDNYPGSWISFAEVSLPEYINERIYQDFQEFIAEYQYDTYSYCIAEHYGRGVYPYAQRLYRKELRKENNNSLVDFNNKYNAGAMSWGEIVVEEKDIFSRNYVSSTDSYLGRFREFKEQSPQWMRYYINPDGYFTNVLLIPAFGEDLEAFNLENNTNYKSWNEIRLSSECPPADDPLYKYWLNYARDIINVHHLSVKKEAEPEYQSMLLEKYNYIQTLNKTWNSDYQSFAEIHIPEKMPDTGAMVEDLTFFIQNLAQPEHIQIHSMANDFRQYIAHKYKDLEILNKEYNTQYQTFNDIAFPTAELDFYNFKERKSEIRREFLWRNYAMSLDQMLSDAKSLRNTGIYVLLSILLAITVNPLAAYALSRFKPSFSYQIILLFMLTMAFPAMVMGIPNFLLLKKLNLLNTFWALVLPAAADGYFIFLLKGFFDSLPREIYESASLDGAGEFRLFWQFTLYLSKPILAVIALGAFNAAYRNFLFAFIVCQDQSMWTLMVHIYNLMQRASSGVGYAALVIAAIPTLMVFIFFQNIIIKGIVIPMEK